MKTIPIKIKNLRRTSYPVHIGTQSIEEIKNYVTLSRYSKIFVITDTHTEKLWLKHLLKMLPENTTSISIDPGESNKNISSIEKIWKRMFEAACDRKTLVINFGGGLIGDLGGFAASTYMRGVDFLQIPTTLLAQVDASVGGKVAVNFSGIKNLVGSFNQPIGVIIDTHILSTLPKREFISGFGEIIKHGLIQDTVYFKLVTSKKPQEFSENELATLIEKSIIIKSRIVENDETETGERKKLNFGHTIGHAVESISHTTHNPLLHGEAVSIGIVAESYLSFKKDLINKDELTEIIQSLKHADLPVTYPDTNDKSIFDKLKGDKKNQKGIIYWTLLDEIGSAVYDQISSNNEIAETISFILQKRIVL